MKRTITLALCFLHSASNAIADSARDECSRQTPPPPAENIRARDYEEQLEDWKEKTLKACEKLEKKVSEEEASARKYQNAVAGIQGDVLASPMRRAESASIAARTESERIFQSLASMKNELNEENNARLNSLERDLDAHVAKIKDLSKNWDNIFRFQDNEAVGKLMSLSTNPTVGRFLEKLPPYTVGKAPAPREGIALLNQSLSMVQERFRKKSFDVSEKERREAEVDFVAASDPVQTHQRAREIALAIRSELNSLSILRMAYVSGACQYSKRLVLEDISLLKAAIQESPEKFRAILAEELQIEISSRENWLQQSKNCPADNLEIPRLASQIERNVDALSKINCSAAAYIKKAQEWLKIRGASGLEKYASIYLEAGSNLWLDLVEVKMECMNEGRK